MWALVVIAHILGGPVMTTVQDFTTKALCEKAAKEIPNVQHYCIYLGE